jgi:hypothetical protein
MPTMNRVLPVKTNLSQRTTPLSVQLEQVQAQRRSLAADPLLKLADAVSLLGNPSYNTLRKWIADGTLHVWRAGRGHFRVRLSEITRFRAAGEQSAPPSEASDATR